MTKERRPETEDASVDLTEAARAVVRDPGDPRIDAHLAALGLGLDADRGPVAGSRRRAGSAAAEEIAELRRRVGELESRLAASQARIQVLALAAGAAMLAVLLLLAAFVLR